MNKKIIVISCISILDLFSCFIISFYFLPIQEVDGRCPNGYHKSFSGDCEKASKVSNERSVDNNNNNNNNKDDGDDDDNNIASTITKKEQNKIGEDNSPLNQIFKSNNKNNEHKEVNTDNTNYKDNIELEGKVTYVVDGDTLDINDIRIRLSLVDTPERGQEGYQEAKNFVIDLCLKKEAQVDIDDGQRRGDRYGREIGIVYCDGINLNAELINNNLASIYMEYCDISEFSNEKWAKQYC
jgi:endonuclease YncB( thermonuclease family)